MQLAVTVVLAIWYYHLWLKTEAIRITAGLCFQEKERCFYDHPFIWYQAHFTHELTGDLQLMYSVVRRRAL